MNEPPTSTPPSPAARTRPFRIPKKLWALGVVAALALGSWWYINAPDLPPGGPLAGLDIGRTIAHLPILNGGHPATPTPEEEAAREKSLQALRAAEAKIPAEQQEAQLRTRLAATGLPITSVTITKTDAGKSVAVIGLDASRLTSGTAFDAGLSSGVEALVTLAKANAIDVSATDHVVVAIADAKGRPLFSASASSAAIAQFRDGKSNQRDFLKTTAIQSGSRSALIDYARSMATR